MKKQKKNSDPLKAMAGKKTFTSPGNSGNEMDADELVHQNWDEEPDNAFDEDEAIHNVKRNTNIEQGSMADIDDLIHENEEEDDELIY